MNGIIKRKLMEKNFGFIRGEDGKEYFFHRSDCIAVPFEQIAEGQQVTFQEEHSQKGPRAANVRP